MRHFSSAAIISFFRHILLICVGAACLVLAAPEEASAVTMSETQSKMNAYINWLSSKGYTTNMTNSDRKYCTTVFWNADLSTSPLKTALNNGDFNTGTTLAKCPRTSNSHKYDAGTCHSNYFSGGRQCNGYVRYFWYYLFGTDLEWDTYQKYSVKYSSYSAAGSYLQRGDMVSYNGHYGIVDYVQSNGRIIFFHANGLGSNYPCGIIHGYWVRDDNTIVTTSILSNATCYIRRHRDLIDGPGPDPVTDCEVYGCSSANGSGTYICTATNGLAINSGHNYSSPTGKVIPYGATVTVTKIASSATYAHVTYNGVSGIASKNFLKLYQPVDECTTHNCVTDYAGYYQVSGTDGSLVLHNAHNYNASSKIGEIPEGTIVWVTKGSTTATYRHVTYGSVQGIMSGNYLKAVPKYTLTLDPNGGSVSRTSFAVWKGVGDFCDLSGFNPSRAGYTFLGWYTAASNGIQIYNSSGKCVNDGTYWNGSLWQYSGNVRLYAHWQANTVYVDNITLSSAALTLQINDSANITAAVSPSSATNKTLSWNSSNPSVATVSNGTVQAVSPGTASIYVSAQDGAGASAVCHVTVEIIPVTEISLPSSAVKMNIGDVLPFPVSVTPSNATNQSVIVWSADDSIAEVDAGNIVAVESGVTTVWAQAAENSDIIASCIVTVLPTVTDIELNRYSLTLSTDSPGSSYNLHASVIPSDGKGRITWFSSDPAVVLVNDQGQITAAGPGKATIMASVAEGPSIGCSVTVKDAMPLLELPLDLTVIEEEAFAGTDAERISIMPATEEIGESAFADSSSLLYVRIPSSVSTIAEHAFENDPKLCIVCASGSAAEEYAMSHGIDFVTDESAAFVPVRRIALPAEAELALGETLQLDAVISPAGASNTGIEWKSDNESVALVSGDGLITPLDIGNTVITASATDGSGKSASCTVTVKAPDVTVHAAFDETGTQILDMSALLTAEITVEGTADHTIGSAGIIFIKGNGVRLASKAAESCDFMNGRCTLSFGTDSDLGVELTPETQYRCRYYVVVCGITFVSNTLTFTTTKGIPRIVIDTPEITMSAGETAILAPRLLYCVDEIVWRSSNSSVAYVLDNEIVAVGPGAAKLTARLASDANVQAECYVTVN